MRGRALAGFVARRLAALALVLAVVSLAAFSLLTLAPGSAEQVLLGSRPSTPELIASIRSQHHLDEPFVVRYGLWLKDAVRLDFGASIRTGRSVASSVGDRAGVTAFLGLYAFVVAVLAGVPLGVLAAVRKRGAVDRGVVGLGVLGVSAPVFVTGTFLLYLFAVELGWFPSFGPGDGFLDRAWHLTLPALALALSVMALILKLTRAAMIDVLDQDHVVFARARGVPAGRVLVCHALRNALVPIVTASGLVLVAVLTGSVLAEVTFALPGLGSLLVEAVRAKDLPVLQGLTLLGAVVIVLVNLAVDVVYAAIDPRIGFGGHRR